MLGFAHTVFGEAIRRRRGDRGNPPHPRRVAQARRRRDRDAAWRPSNPRLPDAFERAHHSRRRPDRRPCWSNSSGEVFERTELFAARRRSRHRQPSHPTDLRTDRLSMLDQLKRTRFVQAGAGERRRRRLPRRSGRPRCSRCPSIATPPHPRHTVRFLEFVFAMLSHVRGEAGRAALASTCTCGFGNSAASTGRLPPARRVPLVRRRVHVADDTTATCPRCSAGTAAAPDGVRASPRPASTLDVTDEAIRADHAAGASRFRALISAPAEARSATRPASSRRAALVPPRPPRDLSTPHPIPRAPT